MATRFADHLLTGVIGDRPAATAVPTGTLYASTDEGLVYQSDGATWADWLEAGGGGVVAGSVDSEAATDGQVLTADGAGAAAWETPAAGAYVGCRVKLAAVANIASGGPTVMAWTAEDFDTDTFHDNSTNNTRITIPSGLGGKYLVDVMIGAFWVGGGSTGRRFITLKKNGSSYQRKEVTPLSETWIDLTIVDTFAAADYLEVDVYQNSGSSGAYANDAAASGGVCYFAVTKIG